MLLYDLLLLSYTQLIVSTVLVLSPAREMGSRFRWTGSRMTEVVVSGVGAVAIAAVSCVLTQVLWGLPIAGLETAAYLLVVVSIVVIALQPDRNVVGQVFYASFASAFAASVLWSAYLTVVAPRSILETITASFVLFLGLAALLVWMSNINYQSDVLTRVRRGRPLPKADPSYQPMVSLHIPAYNEPPELLIETIKAAEQIDYPDFEIVVMDNNTQDPAVWGPVEEYCRDRPRVKFVHVAPWPGYKAGACNLALREYTDPRAEVIGLVDADDIVAPHYLRETVSYFSDPDVGFVQTFEGNREFEGSSYYTACVDSYQGFYLTVMSSRNERDTVPFVGTMGLFRRSALASVGGWNEWCICEDTEASLRVAKSGWSGLYIPRCFGRGIVPPSWAGMLTQRHRWCFGAMQILRLHWRSLMPWDRSPDNHLTGAQRRDYLMASLSWFRDLIMLAFSVLLVVISVLTAVHSGFAVAPLGGSRSLLPLSLILIATVCMLVTLRHWTTLSYRRALLSLVVSFALTLVIARGCIEGVARRDGVFLRTSKTGGRRTTLGVLRLAWWETLLAVGLYVCAGLLVSLSHPPWLLVLLVFGQATFYLCAPIAAVWNLRAQAGEGRAARRSSVDRPRPRALLPRPAAAILIAVCIAGLASAFMFPAPLLHATTLRGALSPRTLLASGHAEVYLRLGSSARGEERAFYPIGSVQLNDLAGSADGAPPAGLSFETSSPVLLGEVLRAAADGGRLADVSLAFRTPGPDGRPITRLIDTFPKAEVASMTERLSGTPSGSASLLFPGTGSATDTPTMLRRAGPFASTTAAATRTFVTLEPDLPAYPVAAVSLSQPGADAVLNLTFTTSALPLLNGIYRAQGAALVINALTLGVRDGTGTTLWRHSFPKLNVTVFNENLTKPLSGTALLAVPSR